MALDLDSGTPATSVGYETADGYPLTALQSGMLYHEIRGVRGVDLEQIVLQTPEFVDLASFSRALHSLVAMHPVLRTRFVWDTDDEPRQEIADGVSPAIRFFDRSSVSVDDRSQDFGQMLLSDRLEGEYQGHRRIGTGPAG